jgi:hypothetical protein
VLTGKALNDLVKEAFGSRGGTFQAMWLILLETILLNVTNKLSCWDSTQRTMKMGFREAAQRYFLPNK